MHLFGSRTREYGAPSGRRAAWGRRLVALLLAAVMACSCIPLAAAEELLDAAVAAPEAALATPTSLQEAPDAAEEAAAPEQSGEPVYQSVGAVIRDGETGPVVRAVRSLLSSVGFSSGSDEEGGEASITLTGLLPVGAQAEAVALELAAEELDIEDADVLAAYDITIRDADGAEWQPTEPIRVNIDTPDLRAAQAEGLELHIYHIPAASDTPEPVEAVETEDAGADSGVHFDAEGFSAYVVGGTLLRQQSVAARSRSDAQAAPLTDDITLTGKLPGNVVVEAENVDVAPIEGQDALAAYDIKIYANTRQLQQGNTWQPSGDTVTVTVDAAALQGVTSADVYHMTSADADDMEYVGTIDVDENGLVSFEAESFSVYVIVDHEGGEVVTPRVEFHFVAGTTAAPETEESVAWYTSGPYTFHNQAHDAAAGNIQTTLIVRSGDMLESIEAPADIGDASFFGWYTVNKRSDSTAYDAVNHTYSGNIVYSWPDDAARVELDNVITISDVVRDSSGAVTSLTWTVNGVSQTVTENIDGTGCAHIYLAPIFDNYHFVNFHLAPYGESSASYIMTRKLIVLGNSNTTYVRVGDINSGHKDPTYFRFIGWDYYTNTGTEQDPNWEWVRLQTLNDADEEIDNVPGRTGTYLTATAEDYDLYPAFVEIRWITYNRGAAHNGSEYLAPMHLQTSDSGAGTYPVSRFDVTTRVGYDFQGWYLNADMGNGSDILNLDSGAIQLTDADGNVVSGPIRGYCNAEGNIVYTPTAGYDLAFEVDNGEFLVYSSLLNRLPVYARWTPKAGNYKVVLWMQKSTDGTGAVNYEEWLDTYTAAHPDADDDAIEAAWEATGDTKKEYDFYTFYTRSAIGGSTVSPSAADLGKLTSSATVTYNGESVTESTIFTGFQLGYYDASAAVDPQGTTVLNVYYDRITYSLKFFFARRQGNGNYYVPYLTGNSLTPPTGAAQQTWQDYVTQSGNLGWADSRTTNIAAICSYPAAGIHDVTNGNQTYYYYEISANYGAEIGDEWPSYDYFADADSRVNNYFLISWWMMRGAGNYFNDGQTIKDTVKGKVLTMDEQILGLLSSPDGNFLIARFGTSTNNWHYNIWQEALDGVDYGAKDTDTIDGVTYVLEDTLEVKSGQTNPSGQSAPAYTGFTYVDSLTTSTHPSGNDYYMNFYYTRNTYSLTFMRNYPGEVNTAGLTQTETTIGNIQYGASMAAYKNQPSPIVPAEHRFDGWFADASNTVKYNFDGAAMPAGNVVVYGGWSMIRYRIIIDPNGGVMDHINYQNPTYAAMLAPTGLDTSATYNDAYATYFNNTAAEFIFTDSDLENPMVRIDSAEAAQIVAEGGDVYRYVNMRYDLGEDLNDGVHSYHSYAADARNALYILDTPASITAYYNYYVQVLADKHDGDPIPRSTWEARFLSAEKYRPLNTGESYTFLGWYELNESTGELASTPYDFSQPTSRRTHLVAQWRLEGGYTLQYTPDYTYDDGVEQHRLTGSMAEFFDPDPDLTNHKYADGATTQAMQEPAAIMIDGVPDENGLYQFRGWQIVRVETIAGQTRYTVPDEEVGVYYTAGQTITVRGRYAQEEYAEDGVTKRMVIHLRAVYEKRDDAYRRPDVINLALDAGYDAAGVGQGYVNTDDSSDLPVWTYPGHQYISDLTRSVTIAAETLDKPYQILFGDTQSNTAVHLYKYAANSAETGLQDAANFFTHTAGYKLIGFDLDAVDTDFVPDFTADAVVAVSPGSSHTLYAVWEPMVYVTFVNDTGVDAEDLTFRLNGTGGSMYVVNQADGSFSRTPIDPNQPITLSNGESLRLVVPYGAGETITVTGTNALGVGYSLTARSELGTTDPVARVLTGTLTGTDADYKKVANTENFGFSDELEIDAEGVVITFTAEKAPHTLMLKDNYDRNSEGTGGGSKEILFSERPNGTVFYQTESETTYDLPSTSTRVGYEFLGWDADWDEDPDHPENVDFSVSNGWTIDDLTAFFGGEEVRTLFGIWKANAEARTVTVWKDVPEPGDQAKDFTFTVSFGGGFTFQQRSGGRWRDQSGTIAANTAYGGTAVLTQDFTLRHSQYLKIIAEYNEYNVTGGGRPYLNLTVEKYQRSEGVPDALIGSATVLNWTWAYRSNGGATAGTGNDNRRNFSFQNLVFSVTEANYAPQYATTQEIAATYSTYPLTSGTRSVSWDDANAGGTVIFHNTRKTADVTVRKTLLPDTLDAATFPFAVAFTNGTDADTYETYDLSPTSFNVTSGSAGYTISGIPTGARLRITETVDATRYTTTTSASSSSVVTDLDAAANVFECELADDTTVTFTNELKHQNVRLVLVDDAEPTPNALSGGTFTLPSVFEGTHFAAENTGLIWEGEVYVGTYTLTQHTAPGDLYRKLQSAVQLTVSDTGVTAPAGSSSDTVTVTYDSVNDVYTVTIVNPKLMLVTVKKTVDADPAFRAGTFGFTATLMDMSDPGNPVPVQTSNVIGTQGTNAQGRITFTLVNSQSVTLYVPRNMRLTVEETEDTAYTTTVKTAADEASLPAGDGAETHTVTIDSVTADRFLLFTNKLKTVDVTVRKTVDGGGGTFQFTAFLRYKGEAVKGYTLTDTPGVIMTADGTGSAAAGTASFTLSPADFGTESIVFTIPSGSVLVLTETANGGYSTSYEVTDDASNVEASGDGLSVTLSAIQTVEDLTVTFTNTEIHVAPTGVDGDVSPFLWMGALGVALAVPSLLVPALGRRRKGAREI